MAYSLIFGAVAFLIALVLGRPAVAYLRRQKLGKAINPLGPASHSVKAGTPTMGGIVINVTVLLLAAASLRQDIAIALPLAMLAAAGLLGFADDLGTLQGRGHGGLTWHFKWAALLGLGLAIGLAAYFALDLPDTLVPWLGEVDLGLWLIPLAVLLVLATTSAVAITDGLDGLAGGSTAIAFMAYGILALQRGQDHVATFAFALVGATLGFLWYNSHPAQVFMGDTGALALGVALAVVAIMSGFWLLLPIIGIVFVLEALSDVIQIGYFKLTKGQRIFRMSPLHHHCELIGWSEPQIVTRFWLIGIAGAALGIALAQTVD